MKKLSIFPDSKSPAWTLKALTLGELHYLPATIQLHSLTQGHPLCPRHLSK